MTYRQPSLFPHLADEPIKTPRTPRTTRRALGNVSQDQFMPITQLMNSAAGDFSGPRSKWPSVSDVFENTYRDRSEGAGGYRWDSLRDDVAKKGIRTPLTMSPGRLVEGHHRAMMAIEQGHLFVPVKPYIHPDAYTVSAIFDMRRAARKARAKYRIGF